MRFMVIERFEDSARLVGEIVQESRRLCDLPINGIENKPVLMNWRAA
jgi:hypothetical protein